MPCLTDLFADRIVAALHLIEGKRAELSGVYLTVHIERPFVGKHIDDTSEHTQTVWLILDLLNDAFEYSSITGASTSSLFTA